MLKVGRRSFLVSTLGSAATAVCPRPVTGGTPAGAIHQSILDAYRAKRGSVVIPAGSYRIAPDPSAASHLTFHDMADFEINARGVELICTDVTRGGIEFVNCRNIRFHGATIGYEVPPFTQGTIEAIASDRSWFDLRIDAGYPANFDDPKYFPAAPVGCLFDARSRRLKSGTYDIGAGKVERLGESLFRLYGKGHESVGDLAAFRGSGRPNILLMNCGQMDIREVTIHNSGMFGVVENLGDGGNRYSVEIRRGPPPFGARNEPLYSTSADGFHSGSMRNGPVLENCSFEGMPDDGIAIHGFYSLVLSAAGDRLVINKSSFKAGDPLLLFDLAGSPAGEAVVTAVTPAPDFRNTRQSQRATLTPNSAAGPYFEILLDRNLAAGFDYMCSNPAALGSGYILRNNSIRNHRGRAILLKAHNGLVEGNTIDGSSISGIVLSPEFRWNEACYSRSVTIRNNVVRNLPDDLRSCGAIVIAALIDRAVPGYGHRHIVLEDNRIENVNGVNLLITSAADVTVRNNHFINAQRVAGPTGGAAWGEDSGALVYVTEAKDVRIEGNTVSGLGAANQSFIKTTSTATDVQSDWK
jgi:hypothetical protein